MKHHLQSVRCWGFASVVAISAPLLGTQVQAAESIFVRYKDTDVTVTQQELNTFTETGELPTSLQNLFSTDQEVPKVLRTVLSEQIEVPEFMQNFLEGSNGDFLFFKLDQAISSTEGRTEVGLESLKKAVLKSIEDDRVSFLEIIDKHPQNTIRVNLTNLEGTYNDVNGFVKKVLPALEVAKDVLSDFICDCKTTQVSPEGSTPASKYQSQQELENCEKGLPKMTLIEPDTSPIDHHKLSDAPSHQPAVMPTATTPRPSASEKSSTPIIPTPSL